MAPLGRGGGCPSAGAASAFRQNTETYIGRKSAMKHIVWVVAGLLTLSGCSMTLPVRGQVQNSDETFSGKATGYMDRSGDLTIVSNKGVKCSGDFVYVTARTGEGVFN